MEDRKSRKTKRIQFAINLTENTWSNIPNHHLIFDNAQLQNKDTLCYSERCKANPATLLPPKA